MKYAIQLIDEATDLFVRKHQEGRPFFESDSPIPVPLVGDQVVAEDGTYEVIRREFLYTYIGEFDNGPTASVHLIGKLLPE